MRRAYVGIAFVMMTACLGLGDVESDSTTNPGGGGIADAGWPDSPAETATGCDAGTKRCGLSCVAFDDPGYGCSATECAPCPLPGAVVFCMNLTCTQDDCLPGRLDCDGIPNGCEVDSSDLQNCGACGNACSTVNGAASCVAGTCEIACTAGFEDCDNDPANGCEASLTTSLHCGTCAKKCGADFACQSGDCHCMTDAACDGGSFGDCMGGTCYCSGGIPCTGGKKCTPQGCI